MITELLWHGRRREASPSRPVAPRIIGKGVGVGQVAAKGSEGERRREE